MNLSRTSRKFVSAALISASAFMPFSAPASAASCPAGSTLVSGSVCQVVFTADGTFTMPSGVSKVEALLVGAGGSSDNYYGGGGGDVRIVELATSGDVTVTVGQGSTGNDGDDSSVVQGSTIEVAAGGSLAGVLGDSGGASGNGNLPGGKGGSGAGAASTDVNGAAGIVVSSLTSTMFKDVSSCYGGGGAAFTQQGVDTSATCGGAYFTSLVYNTWVDPVGYTSNTGSATQFSAVANWGGGAAPAISFGNNSDFTSVAAAGADGRVVIRFDLDGLADTGVSNNFELWAASAAFGLAGIGMLLAGRRKAAAK